MLPFDIPPSWKIKKIKIACGTKLCCVPNQPRVTSGSQHWAHEGAQVLGGNFTKKRSASICASRWNFWWQEVPDVKYILFQLLLNCAPSFLFICGNLTISCKIILATTGTLSLLGLWKNKISNNSQSFCLSELSLGNRHPIFSNILSKYSGVLQIFMRALTARNVVENCWIPRKPKSCCPRVTHCKCVKCVLDLFHFPSCTCWKLEVPMLAKAAHWKMRYFSYMGEICSVIFEASFLLNDFIWLENLTWAVKSDRRKSN